MVAMITRHQVFVATILRRAYAILRTAWSVIAVPTNGISKEAVEKNAAKMRRDVSEKSTTTTTDPKLLQERWQQTRSWNNLDISSMAKKLASHQYYGAQ